MRKRAKETRSEESALWDSADVAHYLKVSVDWVRRNHNLDKLPGGRRLPSGRLRFDPAIVRAWATTADGSPS